MRKSKINISGFKIGTAENKDGLTGVTVILAPGGGATAGVDVRGCALGQERRIYWIQEKPCKKFMPLFCQGDLRSAWKPHRDV